MSAVTAMTRQWLLGLQVLAAEKLPRWAWRRVNGACERIDQRLKPTEEATQMTETADGRRSR